jgi:hypothetical protein
MSGIVHTCRDTTIALKPKFTLPAGAPSPKKLCPGASYSLKVRQHCTAADLMPLAKVFAILCSLSGGAYFLLVTNVLSSLDEA